MDTAPTANATTATLETTWLDRWSSFAAGLRFADLPASVVERTKQVLFDSIGAIAAGAREPEMISLTRRLAELGGTGGFAAPVIGGGCRLPAGTAAFLNGTAGTMLEIDEGNQFARGHPGIHVVPAALVAAERWGRSGADLITAVALGYEVGARVGIASKLRVTMHPHGTWGTVGAAVAVAWLARADERRMREVINVSSCLGLSTSRQTMLQGGTVRNSYAGFSNEIGLRAWEMVEAGFVGEADGVATVYGKVIADQFSPAAMVEDLGVRWEIARNYFKRHAACRYNHGAIDALLDIVRGEGGRLDPAAIERIDIATYVWAAELSGQEPRNMLAAKFSLPFSLATTIVNGAATLEAFRDRARTDAAIRDLARRVFVTEDKALTALLPGLRPARVTVTLTGGRTLTGESMVNKGDTENPYAPEEIVEKFLEVATPVYGEARTRAILDATLALDAAPQVRDFAALLAA
ncbi:MmgE/PrpD family protein [Alsobacter sp. R-9]